MHDNGSHSTDDQLESIRDSVKGIVDQAYETVDRLEDRAREVRRDVTSRGSAFLDRATDFIRNHPLKAVGIAFGVGYLGTRLLRRR